jgi:hypothetical protein
MRISRTLFLWITWKENLLLLRKTQNISSLLVAVTDCAGKVERVAVIKQVAVMTAAPVLENQVPKKGKGGRAAI